MAIFSEDFMGKLWRQIQMVYRSLELAIPHEVTARVLSAALVRPDDVSVLERASKLTQTSGQRAVFDVVGLLSNAKIIAQIDSDAEGAFLVPAYADNATVGDSAELVAWVTEASELLEKMTRLKAALLWMNTNVRNAQQFAYYAPVVASLLTAYNPLDHWDNTFRSTVEWNKKTGWKPTVKAFITRRTPNDIYSLPREVRVALRDGLSVLAQYEFIKSVNMDTPAVRLFLIAPSQPMLNPFYVFDTRQARTISLI